MHIYNKHISRKNNLVKISGYTFIRNLFCFLVVIFFSSFYPDSNSCHSEVPWRQSSKWSLYSNIWFRKVEFTCNCCSSAHRFQGLELLNSVTAYSLTNKQLQKLFIILIPWWQLCWYHILRACITNINTLVKVSCPLRLLVMFKTDICETVCCNPV